MNPSRLSKAALRGGLSTLAGNLGGFLVRFGVNMALARLLLPEQFGEFGLALVYVELIGILASFSFNQALVQLGPDHDRLLGSVVCLEAGVGAFIFIVALAASPLVAAAHADAPVILDCFLVLAAGRVLSQVGAAFVAACHRDFRYHLTAALQFAAVTISSIGALVWASVDADPMALACRDVGAQLVVFLVLGVALLRRHGAELVKADKRSARAVLRLGGALFLNRAIEIAYSRVDQLVVGAALGEKPLGYFVQGRYLAGLPNALLAPLAGVVGLRTLAALGDDRVRRTRTFQLVQLTMTRVLLLFAVGAIVAPDLAVRVILGPNWGPAADLLRVFGVWLVFTALAANHKVLLMARFDWRWLNVANVAALAVVASLSWPAAALADALGVTIVATLAGATHFAILRHRAAAHVDLPPGVYLPAVVAAALAVAAGLGARALPLDVAWTWFSAVLGLGVAVLAYVAALWVFERDVLRREARYILDKLDLRRRRE